MPRTLYVNGRFLTQAITGAQRYGRELLQQFDLLMGEQENRETTVIVLIPENSRAVPTYRHLVVRKVGFLNGQIWEQFALPFYARGGLLFTPCGGAPIFHRKNIVTIHDAAVAASPTGYSWAFRTWYRLLNRFLCRRSLHILTVSNFAKDELIRWYGATAKNTTAIYLGSDHALRAAPQVDILRREGLENTKYVLLVASTNPNKNIAGAVRSLPYLEGSGLRVVMTGHRDTRVFGGQQSYGEGVLYLGYVNDAELRALYEHAVCFAFPSLYEGFGLPPLEALALGCPAVVGDRASLQEVFVGHGLLCDPLDPADIARKILASRDISEKDRERNRQFAKSFTWDRCARSTWAVLSRYR